jgi:hypothetical protein
MDANWRPPLNEMTKKCYLKKDSSMTEKYIANRRIRQIQSRKPANKEIELIRQEQKIELFLLKLSYS